MCARQTLVVERFGLPMLTVSAGWLSDPISSS